VKDPGDSSGWRDLPPEVRSEIEKLIPEGKRIQAIQVYRRHSNGTLKEAKETVDSAASRMGIEFGKGFSPGWSCLMITIAFVAWMGFIAAMPFLAKFVLTEVYGDSLSHGLIESIQALLAIFMILVSVVLFFVWASRRNGHSRSSGDSSEKEDFR
jgi:uncharacterized membrane protein (DUF485 family)